MRFRTHIYIRLTSLTVLYILENKRVREKEREEKEERERTIINASITSKVKSSFKLERYD